MAETAATPLRKDGPFIRLWAARSVSWAGTGVSTVVLPVLVYQRTGSPVLTSLLGAAQVMPYLVFGLFAGVTADRVRRRRLMVGCDLSCAALLGSIPVFGTFTEVPVYWILLVAFGAASCFVWFDAAGFGAIPTLVGEGRIVGAMSALSSSAAVARMVAPAVAGGLLAVLVPTQIVIVDAISYLLSALLLASIRRPFEPASRAAEEHATEEQGVPGSSACPDQREESGVLAGISFLWRDSLLRVTTAVSGAVSITCGAVLGLMVVYGVRALGFSRTDSKIGLLFSVGALGSAMAAAALPRIRTRLSPRRLMLASLVLITLMLPAVALAPGQGWAMAAIGGYMFSASMIIVNGIALRQERAPDHLRSRVNTAGRMIAWGGQPLGALIGGPLVEVLNIRIALLVMVGPLIAGLVLGFLSPALTGAAVRNRTPVSAA